MGHYNLSFISDIIIIHIFKCIININMVFIYCNCISCNSNTSFYTHIVLPRMTKDNNIIMFYLNIFSTITISSS